MYVVEVMGDIHVTNSPCWDGDTHSEQEAAELNAVAASWHEWGIGETRRRAETIATGAAKHFRTVQLNGVEIRVRKQRSEEHATKRARPVR